MLDPVLLRTFLVVAQGNSFSETARKLGLRQSSVSDHIRRLEQKLGRTMFVRDTHSVVLTPEGEALIGFAQSILDTGESAERFFADSEVRGRLRFGASEDLVASFLPDVMEEFTRSYPEIDLECTVALSTTLRARFEAGDLDLVFCKRWPGEDYGELVFRDDLLWVARKQEPNGSPILQANNAVPLVLYRPPSITRSIAIAALTQARVNWRLACTNDSLTGLIAATQAGLGLTVLASRLVPPGLHPVRTTSLPTMCQIEFVLMRHTRGLRAPMARLIAAIRAKSQRLDASLATA